MGYIGVITHLITTHLLTSWDIQVGNTNGFRVFHGKAGDLNEPSEGMELGCWFFEGCTQELNERSKRYQKDSEIELIGALYKGIYPNNTHYMRCIWGWLFRGPHPKDFPTIFPMKNHLEANIWFLTGASSCISWSQTPLWRQLPQETSNHRRPPSPSSSILLIVATVFI